MIMIGPPPEFVSGELYEIDISRLRADPEQARRYFDEAALLELQESIREHGILEPILFRLEPASGELFIVAGERRYLAAERLGLATVPALLVDGDASEISLIENLVRENLTAVEEAEALQAMIDARGYSQEDLARAIGRDKSTLSRILTINRLPKSIRDDCRNNPKCPKSALIEIAKKKTPAQMSALYASYKKKGLTGLEAEKRSRTPRNAEKAELAVDRAESLQKLLAGLSVEDLAETKKSALRESLERLQKALGDLLVNL